MKTASDILNNFWSTKCASFEEQANHINDKIQKLSPLDSGVLVKEISRRTELLYNEYFILASYLATCGDTTNDRALSLIECITVLPDKRFDLIVKNYENLLNEPEILEDWEHYDFEFTSSKRFGSFFKKSTVHTDYLLMDLFKMRNEYIECNLTIEDGKKLFPVLYKHYTIQSKIWQA